jgi:carbamoyl-phosphate synthase large subunit
MRAGETDIAEVVENETIFNDVKLLSSLTKHIANMDCDVFLVDGKPYILEMNARFGGGYPFSHVAGCNLPKAIIVIFIIQDLNMERG